MARIDETRLSRREIMKLAAAGVVGGPAAGWFKELACAGEGARTGQARSCILLWMAGGPSQVDTFDLKPGTASAGLFGPIATNVPGIHVCEHLPRLAQHVDKLAVLRSMSTGEAEHPRASYLMQTGYRQIPGTYHPHIGAIAAAELGRPGFELPNFFWLGTRSVVDSGFLGARHGMVHIGEVHAERSRNLENVRLPVGQALSERRVGLLERMEQRFQVQQHGDEIVTNHREAYAQALRLMRTDKLRAFDVGHEPVQVRNAYGAHPFGRACLLARRLVEVEVPFIGVNLADWDTHDDNFNRMRPLLAMADQGVTALLVDLQARGLLDRTLVIWMGEFGRDPHINANGGRHHYPRAWTLVMAGGGLRVGQVIGRTNALGTDVADRPISTGDFMATICQAMGIDYTKENATPEGRPIRIAAPAGQPVRELFA